MFTSIATVSISGTLELKLRAIAQTFGVSMDDIQLVDAEGKAEAA